MEKARAMLHDSDLPKFLWAEAAAHAVYLKNRTWICTIREMTPYEVLNGCDRMLGTSSLGAAGSESIALEDPNLMITQ